MTGERAAERVRVDAFVKIHGDGQELVFRTRDISEHGLFLYTPMVQAYPIRVGTTLSIGLPDMSCKVVVVRVVEPNTAEAQSFPTGFGVRIIEIADDDRALLRQMIATTKSA